jgi:tetratricopeptide (TPR) repeat protein
MSQEVALTLAWMGMGVFVLACVLTLALAVMLARGRRAVPPPAGKTLSGAALGAFAAGVALTWAAGALGVAWLGWLVLALFLAGAALLVPEARRRSADPTRRAVAAALAVCLVLLAAFMPFNIYLAAEAQRIMAYNNPDEGAVRAALARNPDDTAAHSSLGHILSQRGDETAAMAEWRRVLRAEPDNTDALILLGGELTRAGRVGEARPLFQRLAARGGDIGAGARRWLAGHGAR